MDPGGYGGHPFPPPSAGPQQQFPHHGPQQFPPGVPPQVVPQSYLPPPPIQFSYHHLPYSFVPPNPAPIHPPPPHIPTTFFNPWEPPPHFVPPPSDTELHKRIDKLVEYAAKNGPEFEKMLKQKQQDNPAYSFLFGAEGHHYYRYKLWITVNPHLDTFNPTIPPINPALAALNTPLNPSFSSLPPPLTTLNPSLSLSSSLNPSLTTAPVPSAAAFPSFYEPQHHHQQPQTSQPFFQQDSYSDSDTKPFKGLSGPLPADVAAELQEVLENLTGTKESIKGAKTWFMQRSPFAPALAEALKDRVLALDDADRQLHVIYLANDILFDSLQRRNNIKELDNEALAFQPVLGSMLGAIYHNFQNQEANQTRLQKILQFWAAKEVYSTDIINSLEGEMVAGPAPPPRLIRSPKLEASPFQPSISMGSSIPPSGTVGTGQVAFQSASKWQAEQPRSSQPQSEPPQHEQQQTFNSAVSPAQFIGSSTQFSSSASQQFTANSVSTIYPSLTPFVGSLPMGTPSVGQPTLAQLPTVPSIRAADHPPYPLFPPGLIPGMVRKMQIGSGVPYSALSPLDIPTVIPPSTTSDTYILERVAKFFKEIGEIDPLEGQSKTRGRVVEDDVMEEDRNRVGGARIPPPPNLQVDAETNTFPDGSIEHKPGSTSSGRLGLGAAADPNEVTQYDDVYTSYRKQRSTNYHTTMSARAAAR